MLTKVVLAAVSLLLPAHGLYSGDSCVLEERPGTCRSLQLCAPLLRAVQNAGTPMPAQVRRRLQAAACGFDADQPLVCCLPEFVPKGGTPLSSNDWQGDQGRGDSDVNNSQSPSNRPQRHDNSWGGNTANAVHNDYHDHGEHNHEHSEHNCEHDHGWDNPHHKDDDSENHVDYNKGDTWTYRPNYDEGNSENDNFFNHNKGTMRPEGNHNGDSSHWSHSNRPHEDENTGRNHDSNDNGNRRRPSNSNSGPPDVTRHRNLRILPTTCGVIEEDRIWGGNRTSLYEMPWMVLIAYESRYGTKLSCGGTLVTSRYVLTAAHCVTNLGSLRLAGVVLGEHDVRRDPDCERVEGQQQCAPNARNVSIASVIAHPGYTPQNLVDDIALVRLSEPADFALDNMKPICLPMTSELQTEELSAAQGVVAGWGATEDGLQSPVLLKVQLPVVSNADCRAVYNGNPEIDDRQLCAGGIQDKDSCGGDSGGPLLYPGRPDPGGTVRYIQRGVVSFGSKRCGVGGYPGVYTRVAYYMDWILDNITN